MDIKSLEARRYRIPSAKNIIKTVWRFSSTKIDAALILSATKIKVTDLFDSVPMIVINVDDTVWQDIPDIITGRSLADADFTIKLEHDSSVHKGPLSDNVQLIISYTSIWVIGFLMDWENTLDVSWNL